MTDKMTTRSLGWEVEVPPGTYFLGDPCYAVPDELWIHLLHSCDYFRSPVGEVHTPGSAVPVQVLGFSTAYGDGVYTDHWGNPYPVDAGLIGLTPRVLWKRTEEELKTMGTIITSDHGRMICRTDGSGKLRFGTYRIDTSE